MQTNKSVSELMTHPVFHSIGPLKVTENVSVSSDVLYAEYHIPGRDIICTMHEMIKVAAW